MASENKGHSFNPSTQVAEADGSKFRASQDYKIRLAKIKRQREKGEPLEVCHSN